MRILLDESVPSRLWRHLTGHEVDSVIRRGWNGVKNGKLLALAANDFDVLLSADQGIEYQQNLSALPISVLVIVANSNRMADILPGLQEIQLALSTLPSRSLRKVILKSSSVGGTV